MHLNPEALAGEPLLTLVASLFMAGLAGGFAHCIGMCGPFVLAQVSADLKTVPAERMGERHRFVRGALVPYHLGRLTSYAAMGAVGGALSGKLAFVWSVRWLAFVLLAGAAVFFAVQGMKALGLPLPRFAVAGEGVTARVLGGILKPLFEKPNAAGTYLIGVGLGFLPCGLVYGALAGAAAGGGWAAGALAMAAFTVGTWPALMAVGILGEAAGGRLRTQMKRAAPLFLFASAGLLTYMAWRVVGAL